ncbi:ATP-binding protein [Paenibacillus arenilitoris]|uniref:ATP-binding protein n=1 Tax=Paenibacillus arenilitoris TaxID=2772299 RepID=A0A927H4L6_9BACL|nr:ATP-binding protein [Paenibacillus arenilitoris]MBD2868025.1 ATP-binding protein [Paenibacillus arenilitoris]
MSGAVNLQIPAHAEYLDLVRICLYGIASKMSFAYEDIEDMKVAVSEACNNAILHGTQASGLEAIDIRYEADATGLTIEVASRGTGAALAGALSSAAPAAEGDIGGLKAGGLGLYLMQALMDEVDVRSTSVGTAVVMKKYAAMEP